MRFLVLTVALLASCCLVYGKTVEECKAQAMRCKQYIAPLAQRSGNSKEGLFRAIRTTPLDDICRAAKGFLQCGKAIMDDEGCNTHPQVQQYAPLQEKLTKGVKFICDDNKEAFARAIPCLTTRQFMHRIGQCKKNNQCNSDASWNCARNVVDALCDDDTLNFFDNNWKKIQANHPGCGEDSLLKKFYVAMKKN